METHRKIKAFTLSELVVVLILTSIVVGLAFSVLTLVQKHMAGIQQNFANSTELNKLEQSLWLDFNRYPRIRYDAQEEELTFANDMDSITYRFHDTYIVKTMDTFQIQLQNKTMYFDGNHRETGAMDAIKLETPKALQNQTLFIYKENDATHFMD